VLASSLRSTVDLFFAVDASPAIFASACALATTLDAASWTLWDTALGNAVLTSTAREISNAALAGNGKARADDETFGEVPKAENSRALLSRLADSGRLGGLVHRNGTAVLPWEKSVVEVVEKTIREWQEEFESEKEVGDEKVRFFLSPTFFHSCSHLLPLQTAELLDVLYIAPFLPSHQASLLPLLASLACAVAATPGNLARTAYLSSAVSPAQVLGSTLFAYSTVVSRMRKPEGATESTATLAASVEAMIANFAWHRQVMAGISSLSLARLASDRSEAARKAVYDAILPNLLSEDALLRRASLEIAATLFPPSEAPIAADLVAKCIEVACR
jgi:U3 small nucleolar RNA-associated protein 20